MIADKCEELGLERCEVLLLGCTGTFGIAPAHKHKRIWYKGSVEKLADYNEWVVDCWNCHDRMEVNKQMTLDIFERLRPV